MRNRKQTIKFIEKNGWKTDHLDDLELINLEMLIEGYFDNNFYEKERTKIYFQIRDLMEGNNEIHNQKSKK
mgnify:FL=1